MENSGVSMKGKTFFKQNYQEIKNLRIATFPDTIKNKTKRNSYPHVTFSLPKIEERINDKTLETPTTLYSSFYNS